MRRNSFAKFITKGIDPFADALATALNNADSILGGLARGIHAQSRGMEWGSEEWQEAVRGEGPLYTPPPVPRAAPNPWDTNLSLFEFGDSLPSREDALTLAGIAQRRVEELSNVDPASFASMLPHSELVRRNEGTEGVLASITGSVHEERERVATYARRPAVALYNAYDAQSTLDRALADPWRREGEWDSSISDIPSNIEALEETEFHNIGEGAQEAVDDMVRSLLDDLKDASETRRPRDVDFDELIPHILDDPKGNEELTEYARRIEVMREQGAHGLAATLEEQLKIITDISAPLVGDDKLKRMWLLAPYVMGKVGDSWRMMQDDFIAFGDASVAAFDAFGQKARGASGEWARANEEASQQGFYTDLASGYESHLRGQQRGLRGQAAGIGADALYEHRGQAYSVYGTQKPDDLPGSTNLVNALTEQPDEFAYQPVSAIGKAIKEGMKEVQKGWNIKDTDDLVPEDLAKLTAAGRERGLSQFDFEGGATFGSGSDFHTVTSISPEQMAAERELLAQRERINAQAAAMQPQIAAAEKDAALQQEKYLDKLFAAAALEPGWVITADELRGAESALDTISQNFQVMKDTDVLSEEELTRIEDMEESLGKSALRMRNMAELQQAMYNAPSAFFGVEGGGTLESLSAQILEPYRDTKDPELLEKLGRTERDIGIRGGSENAFSVWFEDEGKSFFRQIFDSEGSAAYSGALESSTEGVINYASMFPDATPEQLAIVARSSSGYTGSGDGGHTIGSGDTLWDLAQRHGTSVAELKKLNPGINPNALSIGSQINLPGGGVSRDNNWAGDYYGLRGSGQGGPGGAGAQEEGLAKALAEATALVEGTSADMRAAYEGVFEKELLIDTTLFDEQMEYVTTTLNDLTDKPHVVRVKVKVDDPHGVLPKVKATTYDSGSGRFN